MKLLYTSLLAISICITCYGQGYTETVGSPNQLTPLSSFHGWDNEGTLVFTGIAQVDTANSSFGSAYGSGGGNILIGNTIGSNFTISNINHFGGVEGFNLLFNLNDALNWSLSNNDLAIEYSFDNINYTQFGFDRSPLYSFIPHESWEIMASDNIYFPPTFPVDSKFSIRFRQTNSNYYYRIDDIQISFPTLLALSVNKFEGVKKKEGVLLNWSIENSVIPTIVDIEKSYDGVNFSSLKKGLQSKNGVVNYTYLDYTNFNSTLYYRLKIIDITGKNTYSKIVNIECRTTILEQIIYPNPSSSELRFCTYSDKIEKCTILLYNSNGQVSYTKKCTLNVGSNNFTFNIENLKPGNYFVVVQAEKNKTLGQFIKN